LPGSSAQVFRCSVNNRTLDAAQPQRL